VRGCNAGRPGAPASNTGSVEVTDDFEHGPVFTDTEFVTDKKPDVCPTGGSSSWAKQDVNGAQVQEMIRNLVSGVKPSVRAIHAVTAPA